MSERMFPVLAGGDYCLYEQLKCPRQIPWAKLEPHREQAMKNHDQTLERLAERGGLGAGEIRCAVEGKSLWSPGVGMNFPDEAANVEWLKEWLCL